MTETLKLNLGCGDFPLDGYHNLDNKNGWLGHLLDTFSDGTVDEVRASHLLEHYPHGQVADVVKEWARVLKPGGKLKIAVPDFDWIIKAYQNGHRGDGRLEHYLFGGQVDADDYHKSFFNEEKLTQLLHDAGLVNVKRWESDAPDCSSYQVSLNLEAMKRTSIAGPANEFLKDARGVIHVGANTGQERDIYAAHNLPVVWIEAIPAAFSYLSENISKYPNQRALRYLITDKEDEEYNFHIASNDYQSSSVFDFGEHTKIWPDIQYTNSISMTSTALKTALQRHSISVADYDTLILDVQGAELLVLKGADVDKFKFIRCEAADFELYKGGCLLTDLDEYLIPRGFERTQTWRYPRPETEPGSLFEALYTKKAAARPQLPQVYIADTKTDAKALYRVAAFTSVPRLGFQAVAGILERAFGGIPIIRGRGIYWEMCMQNGFNSLIRGGADYIITIDGDSIFTAEDVKELLRLVIRYPDADAVAAWQASRAPSHKPLAGVRTIDGKMGGGVPTEDMKKYDLTEVDNTVFGLTVIKTAAIQKIPKPWFLNVPNADGEWEEGKHDSDSRFWHEFIKAGNKLYMANRVRIGHLHEDILWLDDDFNLITQELTDYYAKGRPF